MLSSLPKHLRIPGEAKKLLNVTSSEIINNLAFRLEGTHEKNVALINSFCGRPADRDASIFLVLLDRHTSDHSFEMCQRFIESEERHVIIIEDDEILKNRTDWTYDSRVEDLEPWMWLPVITVLKGPMFAGKTSRLLEFLRYTEGAEKNIVNILKPDVDTRSRGYIKSHRGEAYPVTKSLRQSLRDTRFNDGTLVFIDEAQFFDDSIVEFCMNTVQTQPRSAIVMAGLDFDFRREPFGHLNDLVEILTSTQEKTQQQDEYSPIRVETLLSKCRVCSSPAAYTMRSSNIETQILIGASDAYYPVCEEHHEVQ